MITSVEDDPRVRAAVLQLRARLREHDLRCTQQRLIIVRLLAAHQEPGHLTAFQIHTQLACAGQRLDISTVYRALATLVEIGVLHTTVRPDQRACYGIATTRIITPSAVGAESSMRSRLSR